jgi:hypothetical protein
MEDTTYFESQERARNAAIRWLEARGVIFGPHKTVYFGRKDGVLKGKEVGVESTVPPFWRLRLDIETWTRDGSKPRGPHYNAEMGKGNSQKHAFAFPGTEESLARYAERNLRPTPGREPRR